MDIYADGGVIRMNSSPYGGTWAWCHVSAGERVKMGSGCTVCAAGERISNNTTEMIAVVAGLEAAPDGWEGFVFTDSWVTICRVNTAMGGGWPKVAKETPPDVVDRLRKQLARPLLFSLVLLGGHPNRKELEAGYRKDGKPVSKHNVWCDEACKLAAVEFWVQRELEERHERSKHDDG